MAQQTKETAKESKGGHTRVLQGVVDSDKMQKTIVVKVDRNVKHGQYLKYLTLSTKYKAHDEKREAKVGDRVEIIESRPISREKRWALRKILDRAAL
jgi:small subunit ribosomal protein S17